jgi:hypothetical protein
MLIEQGILKIVDPRKVVDPANPEETINSSTGTTLDYDPADALAIVKKTCDPNFLKISLLAEQGGMASDPRRERVFNAIMTRTKQLEQIINTRLASNSKSPLASRGLLVG